MNDLGTSKRSSQEMGQAVDEMMTSAKNTRRGFERRWYDNNFFYDGYHFRQLSRQTNKIVDLSDKANLYNPMRAIPKASRQSDGVVNLLMSTRFVPVIYPERVYKDRYSNPQEYQQAQEIAKKIALSTGQWVEDEWKNQDLLEKITHMVMLTTKNYVSYLQIWPDADKQCINTKVFDAFDIYLMGNQTEVEESPFVIKSTPRLLTEIKADTRFPEEAREKLTADNREANSEIKQAYERARYGTNQGSDTASTLIQKESFVKERLDKNNMERIKMQKDGDKVLEGKKEGDIVIRQTFSTANITLEDKYLKLNHYPLIDFRMKPGQMYGTSMIERFIPQNKSLDMVVSRVERYTHTMVTGAWLKRQNEQIEFTNQAGGNVIEYATTKPEQAQIAPLPGFIFNFIGLLSSLIDEQGVSLTTLGKLPSGVKGHQSIEALKESEYSNLVMASDRLRQTIRRITERMLEYADEYFVSPQEVAVLEKGRPTYFDVIGNTAMQKRKDLGIPTSDEVIPIKKGTHVDIQTESGLGFTKEGQKQSAKELGDYLLKLAEAGYLPQEAVKNFIEKLLETYQYGSMREFMDAMDQSEIIGGLSPKQVDAMKVAVIEVFKDLMSKGVLPDQETRIQEMKVATMEVVKDAGLKEKQQEQEKKAPSESISFKDLPPEGQAQMAAQAGIQLTPEQIQSQKDAEAAKTIIQDKGQQTNATR